MREYYTRTYSMIFEFILHSDVQYDFLANTILEHIVWFFICTALGRTVRFSIYAALGHTVWFLTLYCTRTYSMIFERILYSDVQYDFEFILHSDVQYDFWLNTILERIVWFWVYTALRRTVWFLIVYYTQTYSMIFEFILHSDV